MFGDGSLTFQEFVMNEPLPLATIHAAVLDFLRDRDDAALFGAQAVNAYVDEPRMTQDVDLLSPRAAELAGEIREDLGRRFNIAVREREIREGLGFRVDQVQKPRNRHLVDIRRIEALPPTERIGGVLVVVPAELIASKLIAFEQRRGKPKSGTDWRDLALLLLKFPGLKEESGPVRDRLVAAGVGPSLLDAWAAVVAQEILPEEEDEDYGPGPPAQLADRPGDSRQHRGLGRVSPGRLPGRGHGPGIVPGGDAGHVDPPVVGTAAGGGVGGLARSGISPIMTPPRPGSQPRDSSAQSRQSRRVTPGPVGGGVNSGRPPGPVDRGVSSGSPPGSDGPRVRKAAATTRESPTIPPTASRRSRERMRARAPTGQSAVSTVPSRRR